MKILVLIDDPIIRNSFQTIIKNKQNNDIEIDYGFSYYEGTKESKNLKSINIAKEYKNIIGRYDLIFSLCSQVFPKELVDNVRCINFHFGILPYACGVAPITFSILNDIPNGFTVHLMNDKIDGGDIIFQEKIENVIYDTAKDIEIKCQKKLIEYLDKNLLNLIYGRYSTYKQPKGRQYFSLKDLNDLCNIDLEKNMKIKDFIKLLRALNTDRFYAYYTVNKHKIKMSINLKREEGVK